jgi:hypothetical protein
MKKLKFTSISSAVLLLLIFSGYLTGCTDSLNVSPKNDVTLKNYFQSASQMKLYTNSYYSIFPGDDIYNGDYSTDDIIGTTVSKRVRGERQIPTNGGGWDWSMLRKINYFLVHVNDKSSNTQGKREYEAVSHFFRAYFYFNKVKRFGDVPWYSKPLKPSDEKALYKKRTPRNIVIDSVMADLDFAINNLTSDKNVYRVTKWTALALKSRVGLYEGTWEKYHHGTIFGVEGSYGKKYLKQCINASIKLIQSGTYKLYSTGNPHKDYQDLFTSLKAEPSEIILARNYSGDFDTDERHNATRTTINRAEGQPGLTKDMVNTYLMMDGTRFTDKNNYNKIQFAQEVKNRDPRLCQTIRCPGYHRIGETKELAPSFNSSVTGYQVIKYVLSKKYDDFETSINDLPIFRYAEVLLNYAEAKAELGTLTQHDLDISINKLRDRVDMPHLMLSKANADPDSYLEHEYPNVEGSNKGGILEIRRERRIELIDENFRWDDLMRWADGKAIAKRFKGMYLPGTGEYDLDQNGSIDIVLYKGSVDKDIEGADYIKLGDQIKLGPDDLVVPHPNTPKKFNENKDYLYPIPKSQLSLNKNLMQNPGWGSNK